jgi:hypothetical protein
MCRNYFINHVIEETLEGRTQVTGRRGRISKQLLDVLKEKRGYWKFKEIALLENSFCKRI